MRKLKIKEPGPAANDFKHRARGFLKVIQDELLPEHAREAVAINMDTGEYVLGKTASQATRAFDERWPNVMSYVCRVDGGAAGKHHGK